MTRLPAPLRGNDIRQRNEKLVLGLIQRSKGISQSEVAAETSLKPPTVLRIFTNLEEENLIRVSSGRSVDSERKGRRPVYYEVRPEALYAVGVDFWARSATVVVVDFARYPILEKKVTLPEGANADLIREKVETLIRTVLEESGIDRRQLLGIGVGAPGRVNIIDGKVLYYSRIPGMIRYPLKDYMESRFDVPVFVHNNSSVIALNEFRYGKGRDAQSLLTILIRSGVGGAFINGGRLLVNNGRTTVELGHMALDPSGPLCDCGRRGCLETYLSEKALHQALGLDGDLVSASIKTLRNEKGEIPESLQEQGRFLAAGIRNLYELFSPELILLLSHSEELSRDLIDLAKPWLETEPGNRLSGELKVAAGAFNPVSAGMGAADLVFNAYFAFDQR